MPWYMLKLDYTGGDNFSMLLELPVKAAPFASVARSLSQHNFCLKCGRVPISKGFVRLWMTNVDIRGQTYPTGMEDEWIVSV